MRENYDRELAEVLEQEGGYSNDPGDPGGPTKYGITIWDARMYWGSSVESVGNVWLR